MSSCWLTLDGFRTCADAVFGAVDLFSLHNNVLETFIICVEAMLEQLTEGHRAVGHKSAIWVKNRRKPTNLNQKKTKNNRAI